MRLLNVNSLELEEFIGDSAPKYAILSHTWTTEEVTFQDWTNRATRQKKKGYSKILGACRQARVDLLQYIWVDTNCIDKSSSAELSEAINSMYPWYSNSAICYGYLVDVPTETVDKCKERDSSFRKSRWFSRGWTLQELIAPKNFIFYSTTWVALGSRFSLAQTISEVTLIDRACLMHGFNRDKYSVARRMSWASDRTTTRPEDTAYSLFGLFDVNMPLLYGEGSKAFIRLQEEILRTSDDQSLLAWEGISETTGLLPLLAISPLHFRENSESRAISDWHHRLFVVDMSEPFSMTNVGLSMTIPMVTTLRPDLSFLVLNYREIFVQYDTKIFFTQRTLIPIRARGGDRFVRAALRKLVIPLPLRPNQVSLKALRQPDVPLSADGSPSSWKGSSASIKSVIMVDHRRVPSHNIGPELEPDFTFAFMPIFPFGKGRWILDAVHPQNCWRLNTGMLVPQSENLSHTEAAILVFKVLPTQLHEGETSEYLPEYLGIFLAASTNARVKLCCRILENVRSDESINDLYEGEISRYLKNTTNGDDNIQWLDYDETQEGVNKEAAVEHGLSPRHHQVVAEVQSENCKVRVSLSLQNVRDQQLVAPVEITFYDLPGDWGVPD